MEACAWRGGGVWFLTEHFIYSAEMMETLADPTLTLLGFEVALKPRLKSPMHVLLPTASRSLDHFGHENWDHQLKLAVAWNRVDIAQSEIFTDERQWKVRLPGAALGGPCWGLSGLRPCPW